jgi:hypothetical protein
VALNERAWDGCDCARATQKRHTERLDHDEARMRFWRSIEGERRDGAIVLAACTSNRVDYACSEIMSALHYHFADH